MPSQKDKEYLVARVARDFRLVLTYRLAEDRNNTGWPYFRPYFTSCIRHLYRSPRITALESSISTSFE